jgi:hypothetical protein
MGQLLEKGNVFPVEIKIDVGCYHPSHLSLLFVSGRRPLALETDKNGRRLTEIG